MKIMNGLRKVKNVTVKTVINVVSVGSGYAVGQYCYNHDIANNTQTSALVGVVSGVAIGATVNSALNATVGKLAN
jgi:hypothetical protein